MLPTPTPVPGSAGRFLDGTFAHMANHSSKAEVFFKGSWQQLDAGLSPQGSVAVWPGEANLLLASERQTYQLLSCSLLRVTPPLTLFHLTPAHQCQTFPCIAHRAVMAC